MLDQADCVARTTARFRDHLAGQALAGLAHGLEHFAAKGNVKVFHSPPIALCNRAIRLTRFETGLRSDTSLPAEQSSLPSKRQNPHGVSETALAGGRRLVQSLS